MAVESRFVVIRNGVEVQTFMDKKAADEYDKMLDIADSLAVIFAQAPVELTEAVTEELSVFLAQNREELLVALQVKKAKPEKKAVAKAPVEKPAAEKAPVKIAAEDSPVTAAKKPVKGKASIAEATDETARNVAG